MAEVGTVIEVVETPPKGRDAGLTWEAVFITLTTAFSILATFIWLRHREVTTTQVAGVILLVNLVMITHLLVRVAQSKVCPPQPGPALMLLGSLWAAIREETVFRGAPLVILLYTHTFNTWLGSFSTWHLPNLALEAAVIANILFVRGHLYQWEPGSSQRSLGNLMWKTANAWLWTWITFTSGTILWAIGFHFLMNLTGFVMGWFWSMTKGRALWRK